MVILAALLERRASIAEGLLVYNLEAVLARYETRDGLFTETISGQSFDMANQILFVFQRVKESTVN